MRKRIIAVGVAGAVGAAAVAYARTGAEKAGDGLVTVAAALGDVETTVLATGTIQPLNQVAVGAQTSGRVVSLKVGLGQRVAAGDLIALIDDLPQRNALRNAKASVDALKAQRDEKLANLEYAEASLQRQRTMVGQNAVSKDAYEQAAATVRATRAQIAALEAQSAAAQVQVDSAQVNLDYTRVTAPVGGTVLAVVTQEGQTVNAVQSAPTIVVLGDVDTVTIKAKISEADVVRLRKGQDVFFTTLGEPDERRRAALRFVEPAPESLKTDNATSASATASSSSSTTTAIYYNGLFDVPNPDGRLLTSMTAQVNVVTGKASNVVTVPSLALRRGGGKATVEVASADGATETREVRPGLDNKVTVEIASGLRAGERVVTGRRGGATNAGMPKPPSPMGF